MKRTMRMKKAFVDAADRIDYEPVIALSAVVGIVSGFAGPLLMGEDPSSQETPASVAAVQNMEQAISELASLRAKAEKATGAEQERLTGQWVLQSRKTADAILTNTNLSETKTAELAADFSARSGYLYSADFQRGAKTAFVQDCRDSLGAEAKDKSVTGQQVLSCAIDMAGDESNLQGLTGVGFMFGFPLFSLLAASGIGGLSNRFRRQVRQEEKKEFDMRWQEQYAQDRAALAAKIPGVRKPAGPKNNLL